MADEKALEVKATESPIDLSEYLDAVETSRLLSYNTMYFRLLCQTGVVPATKLAGKWLIKKSDIEAILNERKGGKPMPEPKPVEKPTKKSIFKQIDDELETFMADKPEKEDED